MTATTRSEIEKVVRKVLDEEQKDSAASVQAIQHLSMLLTEEVIPKLSGEPSEEDETTSDEDQAQSPVAFSSARAAGPSAKGITVKPGVKIGATGRLLVKILEFYPKKNEIYITSAYRPGAHDHHGGLVYGGSPTAAIDIGGGGVTPVGSRRMRDVAKWLYDHFAADTVELIHTTPYNTDRGFYVKNQRKYPGGGPYGPQTRAEHRNHVHFASSKALAQKILARLAKKQAPAQTMRQAPGLAAAAPVWGWDASGHDWKRGPMQLAAAKKDGVLFFTHKCSEGGDFKVREYKAGLDRARKAGIPVLGAYHVLWPGKPIAEARFFFNLVNTQTPWWRNVPWIWQLDAEKFESMPRAPSPAEARKFMNELKRLAGGKGYFVAYAPRWVYGDSFKIGYDLWASDYRGSGAPRPFKEQYKGVPASSWKPYSGRKPRVLQFASDARIGTQHTCDANRFDGDLNALIKLTGHRRAAASAAKRGQECRP